MSIKNVQRTHILYTIEVTDKDILKVLEYDERNNPGLFEQLDNIEGVDNTDYNGFFGPNIYLSIEYKHAKDETWHLIRETINKVIKP